MTNGDLSTSVATPILGWPDPWDPPVFDTRNAAEVNQTDDVLQAIQSETSARVMIQGLKTSLKSSGVIQKLFNETMQIQKIDYTTNLNDLGNHMDMYL